MSRTGADELWYPPTLDVFLNRRFSNYDDARYVAVGASYLNGALLLAAPPAARQLVAAYRDRTPEAVFGGSIYLHKVGE
jgi:hypothetical protein